jgi:CheY-like chemotaxis protein
MLEDLGHTATEVDSAEQGLKILQSDTSIDLVITDHAMPGMTGTELAARIRRSWPELPIAIASGYAELREMTISACRGCQSRIASTIWPCCDKIVRIGRSSAARRRRRGAMIPAC